MSKRCLGCMELFGGEFEVCPHCGYVVGTDAEEAIHMNPGTLLYDRYIIGKVLGYGGFGVTYLGWDEKLEQKVAIKEYLPGEFSTRMPRRSQVTVFNGEKSEQFRDGMKKFVEEAKRLAKFQSERGIVRVFDSFEENNTAYIVMEYLEGETLTSYLKREKTIPEDKAVEMLIPIMESLQTVHSEGLFHRDIAPDNIFLLKNGEVKLIDFGASRYATTSHSRSLAAIIKPGYSPEELYRNRSDQGPHTDVYALSATLYKMITGKTPPDAMERRTKYETKNKEILQAPRKINKKISVYREAALLNALNVRIEDRTPDVMTFIKELNSDTPVKRIHGKIKKIDLYGLPSWLKIAVPSLLACIAVFISLVLTGIINFSPFSEEIVIPEGFVVVPDVEGEKTSDALKMIESGKLLVSTSGTVQSEYISAGKIILQSPVGGSYMDVNGMVMLTVSSGKEIKVAENGKSTVPYVIWDEKGAAIEKLKKAGLGEPNIEEAYDENVALGQVISQSVGVGEEVAEGTVITLKVSLGAASFAMPNVEGDKIDAAEETLTSKGLIVQIEYEKNNGVAVNTVISQDVKLGTEVKRGDKVTLVVSSGKNTILVANVVGKTSFEATETLKQQDFKVTILENYDANVASGKVISQSPAAGTSQLSGATITVYVSKGKQPVIVKFDGNGGTVSQDSITVDFSSPYGNLPSATRSGYSFAGWYLSTDGGVKISSETAVTTSATHTLYAHWTQNAYTLTFNANGGSVGTQNKSIADNGTYGELPQPTRDYYSFSGWFTAANGGVQVSSSTKTGAGNVTVYAHWTENQWIESNSLPGNINSSNAQIQYSYQDKETITSTESSLSGWTSNGTNVEYGNWTNAGWTKSQPQNSDTLKITDTKTVTDQRAHGYIYYYYDCGTNVSPRYRHEGSKTSNAKLVEKEFASPLPYYATYSYGGVDYKAYRKSSDDYIWFLKSSSVPEITHTEWYYQTRTATTIYSYYRWNSWSGYSDNAVSASETRNVRYRYRMK